MSKTNTAALAAFLARNTDIDAMLERLAARSADHFECGPEHVNWAMSGRGTITAPAKSPTWPTGGRARTQNV